MLKVKGIYKITNKVNGKVYIGSSKSVHGRWLVHKLDLYHGRHHSDHFQKSYNKYGKKAYKIEVLEVVKGNKDKLVEREQYWIDFYKSYKRENGYNICRNALHNAEVFTFEGLKHSKATKKLMSAKAIKRNKDRPNLASESNTKRFKNRSKRLANLSHGEQEVRIKKMGHKQFSVYKGTKLVGKFYSKKVCGEKLSIKSPSNITNCLLKKHNVKTVNGYNFKYE